MGYGAIDLHLRRSNVRILAYDESIVLDCRIETTRAALTRVLAGRPRLRMLLESSTESERVARHLEGMGHEALANRRGLYRRAHRVWVTELAECQLRERGWARRLAHTTLAG